MNIFLSWSGKKSYLVAKAFETFLPYIFNGLDFYFSASMDKGVKWEPALDNALDKAEFGILCVTKENLSAPWLMYEAGALCKTAGAGFVTPFLLDIGPSELTGPLTQFQLTVFEKEDLKRLISRIDQRQPEKERIGNKILPGQGKSMLEIRFQAAYETFLEQPLTDALNAPDDAKSVTQKLLDLSKANQTLLKDLLFELQTRCP